MTHQNSPSIFILSCFILLFYHYTSLLLTFYLYTSLLLPIFLCTFFLLPPSLILPQFLLISILFLLRLLPFLRRFLLFLLRFFLFLLCPLLFLLYPLRFLLCLLFRPCFLCLLRFLFLLALWFGRLRSLRRVALALGCLRPGQAWV